MDDTLVPQEQKTTKFYGDELTAILADDGRVYASIRHMCQALGIDENGQRQRMRRHTVMAKGLGVCKIHTPGGEQSTIVLRVDLVPLWLSGIRASMVNEDVRPKLERFQEEAADVLWEAFQDGRLTADSNIDELVAAGGPAAEAYQMAQAILRMARQQLVMESRIDDHEMRLEELESRLSNDAYITNEQASQISQAVKAIALVLGKQTKRNEFGAIYGELYRKFGVTSYREIPSSQYQAAMSFLTEWYQTLAGDSPF